MNTNSFYAKLLAVLNDVEEIPGLANNQLSSLGTIGGETVPHSIPGLLVRKIVRLQTLRFIELEKTDPPEQSESILGGESGFDDDALIAYANSNIIEEDGLQRANMLDQIIIELVRHCFAEENEHFGVRYHMHSTRGLLRIQTIRNERMD